MGGDRADEVARAATHVDEPGFALSRPPELLDGRPGEDYSSLGARHENSARHLEVEAEEALPRRQEGERRSGGARAGEVQEARGVCAGHRRELPGLGGVESRGREQCLGLLEGRPRRHGRPARGGARRSPVMDVSVTRQAVDFRGDRLLAEVCLSHLRGGESSARCPASPPRPSRARRPSRRSAAPCGRSARRGGWTTPPRVDLAQDLEDALHHLRREAERGLVEQEQRGPAHERAGDREHLLLAAGEGARHLGVALLRGRGKSSKERVAVAASTPARSVRR